MKDEFDFAPMCYPKEKEQTFTKRVDNSGRVDLPKEFMRQLRIRKGDPIEVVIENGNIVLKVGSTT